MDISAIAALAPVIPVLTIERAADAVPLARALAKGGLPALEITLRTRTAMAALEAIAQEVPDAVVGAGTVLEAAQVEQIQRLGAKFAVSPGAARPPSSRQPGRPACRSCPVCKPSRRRCSWPSRDTGS